MTCDSDIVQVSNKIADLTWFVGEEAIYLDIGGYIFG